MGKNEGTMFTSVWMETTKEQAVTLLIVPFALCQIVVGGGVLHCIEPRENLWVTWVNRTGQSAFCLSLASATELFHSCLIGVPSYDVSHFANCSTGRCAKETQVSNCSAKLIRGLNHTLPWDTQELNLLGSMRIGNTTNNWTQTCFVFAGPAFTGTNYFHSFSWSGWTNVTPTASYYDYRGHSGTVTFCGTNDTNKKSPQSLGAYGMEMRGGLPLWNNDTPKALPPDVFLICGDRAWQGILHNVYGGPCYLGQLTLLAPDQQWWKSVTTRPKRSNTGLSPNCDDRVTLSGATAHVFTALFVPGGAAASALNQLGKLACWAAKQANVTTKVLSSLLEDQNSLRHAVLQNRAAIDFLLLAQGHGCEDFEGMCCMNLSDHSESIHKQLQWLKQHTNQKQQNEGYFDGLLTSLFGNLPAWLKALIVEGLCICIVLIVVGVIICICFNCLKKALSRMIDYAWLAQKQEGGIVESWLDKRGHSLVY